MNVLLPKQFNVDKIKYSEMKIMKSGAKSIYVNYQGYKINIQTPVLNIPYGVNDNMQFIKDDPKRKDETQKYDITVSFKGIDENQKIKVFHDKLIELENKILEDAFANRVAWFKNNFDGNKGTVSNMFSRIIRRDKDKETGMFADKYPPTFKAKIPYDSSEDKFDFDSYDMDNNEIDFKDYVSNLKGGKAQFIIQLTGIWFSAGMFGCSWKIVSAKFQKVNSSKITFVKDSDDDNVDDDEDDDDIEVDTEIISKSVQKHQVATDAAAASATTVSKTPVVSSKEEEEEEEEEEEQEEEEEDDEEEEEDTQVPEPEPEPEPEPVKPAVKKVVNKKK
jgi:ribosomal protein L12E/L44/L45/RPP1/RPP2